MAMGITILIAKIIKTAPENEINWTVGEKNIWISVLTLYTEFPTYGSTLSLINYQHN